MKAAGRSKTSSTKTMPKAPYTARGAALDILVRVEKDKSYSNLLLNQTLNKHQLERADAALATEIVYGTIQRMNTLDYFLNKFVSKGMNKLEPWVRCLLRLSLYQLLYLDRIPEHAAVNEAVNMASRRSHKGTSGLVNGVLRSILRDKGSLHIPENMDPIGRIALQHSHPEWLVSRWADRYGLEAAERICAADNEPPKASVRVNPQKWTREEALQAMRESGLQAEPSRLSPQGIVVTGGGNLANTGWYRDGRITVQDESSMLVAAVLGPAPGMKVLDCCAAPGGKTTHIAELLGGRGSVCASDIHEHKVKLVREQAERLGLEQCIETLSQDARKLPERFAEGTFDAVLLDAPCTGFGVIRRKPDLKWSKDQKDIDAISVVQKEILDRVARLVKPGGVLVYSTCTIEREENDAVVDSFLQDHPDFMADALPGEVLRYAELERCIPADRMAIGRMQLLPYDYGSDGFYIARLQRSLRE